MTRILAVLIPLLAVAPFVSAEEPIRERIEWSDVWVTDAEKAELPRVLLIGDSITWGYTEEQYRKGLLRLMETFEKSAPKAKLIWATTTPVREANNTSQVSERTERVRARNRIAAAIMQNRGVLTNDLFGLVEQHADWHSSDGTHFNAQGKGPQAAAVAEAVLKCLANETGNAH